MNVAFLNTFASGGGTAIAANRLARALNKNSIAVKQYSVLEGTQIKVNSFKDLRSLVKLGIEKAHFTFYEKNMESRYQFSTAITGFNMSMRRSIRSADIIHLHWFNQGMLSLKGMKKLLKLGKPIVWTMHDMWAFTGGCHYSFECDNYTSECGYCPMLNNPAKYDLSNRVLKKKLSLYQKYPIQFVTCSQWLGSMAQESSLLSGQSVTSIPNPIDSSQFKPEDKAESKKALEIPEDKITILFGAANINDKRKGFKYLENALRKLKFSNPLLVQKFMLIVFGNTDINHLRNIPVPVKSLGFMKNPELAYNAADVFVLPSLEDNLPNTIMEALACGTPCVAFDVGGIPEMVDHKQNGYLAEYKSNDDLAKGIKWITQDADTELIRENARKKVLDSFGEDIVAKRYIELYKKILDEK